MLKVFSILKRIGIASDDLTEAAPAWSRDPLQHPDLARMDERALADLPFPGWPWPRAAASGACDHSDRRRRLSYDPQRPSVCRGNP
ncbi:MULTISPECIES: hypothetical protein [Sinorhizobium]|uniref:hypothetical protein n=1 Tax=Sinorhizobium TaxID=28105 RepID=UPI0011450BCA|nr:MULTISPECIES: hypothetical protein [Sinorhizobium]